jgi:ribulose 1,5-bisphosphate carboxylase large subunit-like protein
MIRHLPFHQQPPTGARRRGNFRHAAVSSSGTNRIGFKRLPTRNLLRQAKSNVKRAHIGSSERILLTCYLGVHTKLITKLHRPARFDAIIMPRFRERVKIPENELRINIQECFKPLGHLKKTLSVHAGSQWAGSNPMVYEKLRTVDFGIVLGRGVFNHPMGPKAGAASLTQGWEAFQKGLTLEEYACNHP